LVVATEWDAHVSRECFRACESFLVHDVAGWQTELAELCVLLSEHYGEHDEHTVSPTTCVPRVLGLLA
jgi:hypothetical protein